VSSTATLTHNGGGDSQTIANMVAYAVNNYGGDSSRVYATGTSSGKLFTEKFSLFSRVFRGLCLLNLMSIGNTSDHS
jgi:poly(3-hydroxybutyrate) depolymerase